MIGDVKEKPADQKNAGLGHDQRQYSAEQAHDKNFKGKYFSDKCLSGPQDFIVDRFGDSFGTGRKHPADQDKNPGRHTQDTKPFDDR